MDLFKTKYAPRTLDDYIGGSYTTLKFYIEQSLAGKETKGFILYGLPGCGKSTMVNVLAEHYNMDLIVTNASDERNTINGDIMRTSSLVSDVKKLIVFDECDGLTDKAFKELGIVISNYSPIILICNDISKIPQAIKAKCNLKEVTVNKFELKNLAIKIIRSENLNISKDKLNKDLSFIKSYRSLLDYLQFDHITEKGSFTKSENLRDEITFINDNSESPKMISLADIFLKRSQMNYKNGAKISKFILDNIDVKSQDYPRTYKLIHQARNHDSKKQNTGTIRITGFK